MAAGLPNVNWLVPEPSKDLAGVRSLARTRTTSREVEGRLEEGACRTY